MHTDVSLLSFRLSLKNTNISSKIKSTPPKKSDVSRFFHFSYIAFVKI